MKQLMGFLLILLSLISNLLQCLQVIFISLHNRLSILFSYFFYVCMYVCVCVFVWSGWETKLFSLHCCLFIS